MTVRETSRDSHQLNLWSGVYSGQRLAILHSLWILRPGQSGRKWISRRNLASVSSMDTSAMAHPINDLIEAGLVEESDTPSPCPITGRNVYKVRLKP